MMVPSSPSQQHSTRSKNGIQFADTGALAESPRRPLSASRQQRSRNGPHDITAGYVVSIPSSAHGVETSEFHSDDDDAASETSEITWLTFHAEQVREKMLRERVTASAAVPSIRPGRRERSDSDANYSRMTNVGVLEVDFGHNPSDDDQEDDDDDDGNRVAHSDKVKPKPTARRPTKDTTTSEMSHEKHLLDHIIELKLQLAQKQAVIDKLSGENRRLQLENDHFRMRSKQNLTPVDENSPHFVHD
mmetsp:Transcript_29097/g.59941  ORF Transcript_29097/g.59941 Transcript_29097/m.59941 type:complete len:246 (-) Transcript_29097:200-937(-)